jgi:deazaflavin-dependent oxidoreductase (nitroreductase family)
MHTVKIDEVGAGQARRAFPAPGSRMYDLLNNPEYKASFHAGLQKSNWIMVALYRLGVLPLFGLSRQIMLLSTQGRKTHKMRHFPVGYYRIEGVITLFSGWGKGANWYKNMQANPGEVYVQIGLRRRRARAEVASDPLEVCRALEWLVTHNPQGAKTLMGWDPAHDRLDMADFSPMAEKVLMVRFFEREE